MTAILPEFIGPRIGCFAFQCWADLVGVAGRSTIATAVGAGSPLEGVEVGELIEVVEAGVFRNSLPLSVNV